MKAHKLCTRARTQVPQGAFAPDALVLALCTRSTATSAAALAALRAEPAFVSCCLRVAPPP